MGRNDRIDPSIPTASDINVDDSLDERAARQHFNGKDLKQAELLFRDNFLAYQEDLMWMGPRAFCYYIDAAIKYLLSKRSSDDSGALSSFCGLIEFRIAHSSAAIASALPRIRDAVRAILADFRRFKFSKAIYGDLEGRYRRLLERLPV